MEIRGFEFSAATGAPLSGLTVEVWDAALGTPAGAAIASTTTDANGMWAIDGLSESPKDVKVSLGGRYRWYKGYTRHSMSRLFLQDGINAPGVGRNLLVNPGFEVWTKGNGPYTVSGVQLADGWTMDVSSGASLSISRESTTIDSLSRYAAAITYTHAGIGSTLRQNVEEPSGGSVPYSYRGRTMTFSFRAYSTVAGSIQATFSDFISSTGGDTHTGSGWETLSVTKTLDPSANAMQPTIVFKASGNFIIDNASLVYGAVPLPYTPDAAPIETLKCLSRIEKQGGVANSYPRFMGYLDKGADDWIQGFPWTARKAAMPTVTIAGSWNNTNCTGPVLDAQSQDGYAMHVTSVASGLLKSRPVDASTYVIGECVLP